MADTTAAEALARLRELSDAATPGMWVRSTEGHASELDVLLGVGTSLRRGGGEIRWTDATYILHGDGTPGTIAFVGNGPRQADNGEFIVASVAFVRSLLDLDDRSRAALVAALLDGHEGVLAGALRKALPGSGCPSCDQQTFDDAAVDVIDALAGKEKE